jgi:HAMP domain-containing protein
MGIWPRFWHARLSMQGRLFRLLAGMSLGTLLFVTLLWLLLEMRDGRDHLWFIALVCGLGCAGSVTVAHVLSAGFTRPLIRLREGTEQIGRGHLHYRVPVETNDEIGELARQCNAMADQLQAS